jgi:4,5-DOPA dioxygenase extradiol
MRQPAFFLSHGAPTIMLEESDTTRFWKSIPALLPAKPRAVLCVSAHWDAPQLSISGTQGKTGIMHDFYGFPEALYDIDWQEHDDAETSAWLRQRLQSLQLDVVEVSRPKDHGVWVPLKTAWEAPDFPVFQLSLNLAAGLPHHWALGQKLQALRDEGVLIIGSGGITHNLRVLEWAAADEHAEPWAAAFVEAVEIAMAHKDRESLCQPLHFSFGKESHPTLEHYVPLLVVMGAAGEEPVRAIHHAWKYGNFALHAYAAGI